MSKLNMDGLKKAIDDIIKASNGEVVQAETMSQIKGRVSKMGAKGTAYGGKRQQADGYHGKKRKFVETVELQVGLKDYDTQRDKRFSGVVKLPHVPRPRMKICVLGDAVHCEQAQKLEMPFKSVDDLKKLNKNKKMVKKLARSHDAFMASQALIPQIPRLLGPGLNKAGKFPTMVSASDSLEEKATVIKSNVKFQLKKVLCLGVAVGNTEMDPKNLRENTVMAINFLVSLLKKNWNNVNSLFLKSTMGPSVKIH